MSYYNGKKILGIVVQNGSGGSDIVLDPTLSIEGAAADAKVVGEKLAEKVNKATTTSYPGAGIFVQTYSKETTTSEPILQYTRIGLSNVGGSIPIRLSNGTIEVGPPQNDNSAVTKKYVDDLVANSGGGKLYKHVINVTIPEEVCENLSISAPIINFEILSTSSTPYKPDTLPWIGGDADFYCSNICFSTLCGEWTHIGTLEYATDEPQLWIYFNDYACDNYTINLFETEEEAINFDNTQWDETQWFVGAAMTDTVYEL